jgi:hypothetical protein
VDTEEKRNLEFVEYILRIGRGSNFNMSRLSRANLKARESVFAGGPEQYRGDIQAICPPNLEECVYAVEDCCEEVPPFQRLVIRSLTTESPGTRGPTIAAQWNL